MINITEKNNELAITGELTRQTISSSFERKSSALMTNKIQTINLHDVAKVDTAGMALLLMLLEQAQKNNQSIHFTHLPEELLKLAQLSAVDKFLPIK